MRLASYSFIALVAILTGCSEPEVVESRPRPVVSMIVEQPIDQSSRSFSGLVSAGDATNLAFEVSGRTLQNTEHKTVQQNKTICQKSKSIKKKEKIV